MIEDDLKRYRELRASYASARAQLSKREQLSTGQRAAVAELDAKITQLDSQVADAVDDLQRSGRLDPTAAKIAGATRTGGSKAVHTGDAGDWATRAADAIWAANGFKNGEVRGITASSIDLPALVLPQVVAMERPKRIIDLLVDRMESPSNATEYWQQTVRTNNAAMTADLATKPTSVFTVQPVQDRLRVLAHLSEPIPNRLWLDYSELRQWLITELYQGLLDALEEQVINGDGPAKTSPESSPPQAQPRSPTTPSVWPAPFGAR